MGVSRLEDEGGSEPDGHIATAGCLESFVSEISNDLVSHTNVKAVHGAESTCASGTVDQILVFPLHIYKSKNCV